MNIAKNDITGKYIKSNPPNAKYTNNWDKIYAKKNAHEWLKTLPEIKMIDPDGWKYDDITMDTPINWYEFQKRLNKSTITENINYE